jgi:hypothetical protein
VACPTRTKFPRPEFDSVVELPFFFFSEIDYEKCCVSRERASHLPTISPLDSEGS